MKKEYANTGYMVDEDGTVFGKYSPDKPLKSKLDRYGYLTHGLSVNGKMIHRTVHRMVAETFLNNLDNLPQVNHINGIKTDNRLDNLEWCTAAQNNKHRKETGLGAKGETIANSSITEQQAKEVCQMIQDEYRNVDIVKATNVPRHVVQQIRSNKTWLHISELYEFPKIAHQGISNNTFLWVCNCLQDGMSYKDILAAYTGGEYLTYSCLKKIKNRRMRKELSSTFYF